MKNLLLPVAAATAFVFAAPAHAASVFLTPATQEVLLSAGQATVDLRMDFGANEATLGGGVDLSISGPVTFASFMPSSWFTANADPAFSGFGTARADGALEVHFGNFNGLSGQHVLGTVTLNLTHGGGAVLGLAINSFWGDFYSVTSQLQSVTMGGATIAVVPEPASAWLLLAGAAALAGLKRRKSGPLTAA